jgi:hypothetical protein
LVLVDGKLLTKGSYPGNELLRTILQEEGIAVELGVKKKTACGCGPGCC